MGGEIDARADQYALAATAFHLFTGAPPYQHSNPVAVISQHLTAPLPKLSKSRPELAGLDEVLSRALAKNPEDRFEQCHDFAAALTQRADMDSDSSYPAHGSPAVAVPMSAAETQVALTLPSGIPASNAPKPKRRRRSRPLSRSRRDSGGSAHHRRRSGYVKLQPKELAPAAAPPAASPPAASPPARPPTLLDGTYRFDYDYEKQTINGAPYAIHTTDTTAWWAFRSWCGSTGCVATVTQLDTNNPKSRAPQPSQAITASPTVIGYPRPFSASWPNRAALAQADKSSRALIFRTILQRKCSVMVPLPFQDLAL